MEPKIRAPVEYGRQLRGVSGIRKTHEVRSAPVSTDPDTNACREAQALTIPFKSLSNADNVRHMLCQPVWFVISDVAQSAQFDSHVIQATDLQCTASKLASGALDSRAPLHAIQYFSRDAWIVLQATVREKKTQGMWYCGHCKEEDDGSLTMIACDLCLEWFHWQCIGLEITACRWLQQWFH